MHWQHCFKLYFAASKPLLSFHRMALIQRNFKLIITLQVACFFSNANFPVYFRETLSYGRRHRETNPSVKEVHSRLQNLLLCFDSKYK